MRQVHRIYRLAHSAGNEAGSVVLLALVVSGLIVALGIGLVTLSTTEQTISTNYKSGTQALYGAEAIAQSARIELSNLGDWSGAVSGRDRSSFFDQVSTPTTVWGESLDLAALTNDLQRRTEAASRSGTNTPRWQLYASGALDALVQTGVESRPTYLVAWVSDDVSDDDGNPLIDSNGVVVLRAQAIQQGGGTRSIQIILKRGEDDSSVTDATIPSGEMAGGGDSAAMARFLPPNAPDSGTQGAPLNVRVLSWREVR